MSVVIGFVSVSISSLVVVSSRRGSVISDVGDDGVGFRIIGRRNWNAHCLQSQSASWKLDSSSLKANSVLFV